MKFTDMLSTLVEAADAHAETLSELINESSGEAQNDYEERLFTYNEAINAAREWLRNPAPIKELIR